MPEFDVDPPLLSPRKKIFGGASLLVVCLTAYFALWGSVVIENKSGRTIDRFTMSIDDDVEFEETSLKPGESARISFSVWDNKTVQVSAKLKGLGSSRSSFNPGFFPGMALAIEEDGSIEFKRKGMESSTMLLSWPRASSND